MDDDIDAQTIWLLEPMHLGGSGVFGMPGLPPDMSVKIDNVGRLGQWPTGGGHTVELRFSWRCPRRRTVNFSANLGGGMLQLASLFTCFVVL